MVWVSGLSTIHFYIILKQTAQRFHPILSLSTIHFYIILKPANDRCTLCPLFEYHTFLHHSQTSNLKMNCFHLRKTGTQTSDGY